MKLCIHTRMVHPTYVLFPEQKWECCMFVFVSLDVKHVPVAVPVQFQETIVTVEEGEHDNLMVTLTALADHDYDFVVFVMIMDGTAERMHFTQCGVLCSVHRCFIPYHILGGSDYEADEVIPVTFHAGQNSANFSIRIIDNDIAECPEQINLLLEVPDNATEMGVVTKEDYTAVVNITDTWDGMNLHTWNYVHDVCMYVRCEL